MVSKAIPVCLFVQIDIYGLILLTRGFIFASVYTISWSSIPGKRRGLLYLPGLGDISNTVWTMT